MRGIVEGSLTFQELLDKKKECLRIHSVAFLSRQRITDCAPSLTCSKSEKHPHAG